MSQYDTDIVYTQYDGWADFPDRPWHLLADVNALAGVQYLHTPTAFASPSDAVEVSSVRPLQHMGAPAPIINGLNNFLTPIVNEGYSQ